MTGSQVVQVVNDLIRCKNRDCRKYEYFDKPLDVCLQIRFNNALDLIHAQYDLINAQQGKIEKMKEYIDSLEKCVAEGKKLEANAQKLVQENKDLKYLVEDQRKELRETKDMYWQLLKGAKVEAYLEFAKELNKQDFRDCWQSQIKQKIDHLANELIKRNGNKW